MTTSHSDLPDLYRRLQKCISDLSFKVDTTVRAVTDRYYSCLDPGKAEQGADGFPVQFRPHGRDPKRALYATKRELLCHEISVAFLAYYDRVLGKPDDQAHDRVARLETIIAAYPNVVPYGDPKIGHCLLLNEEFAARLKAEEEAEAKKWEAEDGKKK